MDHVKHDAQLGGFVRPQQPERQVNTVPYRFLVRIHTLPYASIRFHTILNMEMSHLYFGIPSELCTNVSVANHPCLPRVIIAVVRVW